MTTVFLVLTAVVFVGPASLLSVPGAATAGGALVVAALAAILVGVQVAGLEITGVCLAGRTHPLRFLLFLVAADLLAIGNAVRLALGLRWGGLVPELVQALWFAAPLALWALAVWPDARGLAPWWASPLRWTLVGLPVAFLLTALSRVDFRSYTGVATPTPVSWLLVYAPTLLVITLALLGWLAFEQDRAPSRTALARAAGSVLIPAAALGFLLACAPMVSFILSATVTWGTGYQVFVAGPGFAPLGLALSLLGMACGSYLAVLVRLQRGGRTLMGFLLALAAVLSGTLPNPVSVLGSLLALQLLWAAVTPAAAPPP